MKILSIGTHLFSAAWREAGHRVRVVTDYAAPPHPDTTTLDFFSDPNQCAERVRAAINEFCPDVIFQGDHSTPLVHYGVEDISLPKVWYAIDSHIHRSWHLHYAAAFSTVFCAQKPMVEVLRSIQPQVTWLPLFCQRTIPFTSWHERPIDVAFVGTLDPARNPERVKFFGALKRLGIAVHYATGEFSTVYRASKIVVNQSVADDLNFRVFEATGCGVLLVTDRLSYATNDILTEGVDCIGYTHNDAAGCADAIRAALADPAKSAAMALSAYTKVSAGHLTVHRAKTVLAALESAVEAAPGTEQGRSFARVQCAWALDRCSRLAIPPHVAAFFAERSKGLTKECRDDEQVRPWAMVLSAGHALDNNNPALASSLLCQVTDPPRGSPLRHHYLLLSAMIQASQGAVREAAKACAESLAEYPGSVELKELERMLLKSGAAHG